MMGYYNTYGSSSWMLLVMIAWPLILAAAIWAVVAVTRGPRRETVETPEEVLRGRFARGEISQQEYVDARAILKGGSERSVQRS